MIRTSSSLAAVLFAGASAALLAHLPPGQAVLTTAGPLPAGARPARTLVVDAGTVHDAG